MRSAPTLGGGGGAGGGVGAWWGENRCLSHLLFPALQDLQVPKFNFLRGLLIKS